MDKIQHHMQERFLNLEHQGHELNVRYLESENGNENKQKHILFLHGLGSSSERWLDIPEALYFHTIAIDLPGFGGSAKRTDMEYTIEAYSNIIREFMGKISIGEQDGGSNNPRTTLVGHSLGGYIASSIAASAHNNNFLEKLVLVDSSGNLEKPTPLLDEYLDAAMNPSKEKVRKVFEQMVANPLLISDA